MTLIGRIGADPVMRQTAGGKDFLIYKVATSDFKPMAKEGGELIHNSYLIFPYQIRVRGGKEVGGRMKK